LIGLSILQINALAKETANLKNLEKEISKLSLENQKLQIESSKLTSEFDEKVLILNQFDFEETKKIYFIVRPTKEVAKEP
jgi:regulator of replication initiation timing